MGWVTKLGPGRCQFLLSEHSRFSQIGHIIFQALVALETGVPFTCHFVACSSRIEVDRQTDTHTHTDGQTKYRNPRCACAPRVNQFIGTHNAHFGHVPTFTKGKVTILVLPQQNLNFHIIIYTQSIPYHTSPQIVTYFNKVAKTIERCMKNYYQTSIQTAQTTPIQHLHNKCCL